MASGLSKQAAELPKIASISPSLSLPKIQTTNGGPASSIGGAASGAFAGTEAAGVAAAATASTAAVGEAVNQVNLFFSLCHLQKKLLSEKRLSSLQTFKSKHIHDCSYYYFF